MTHEERAEKQALEILGISNISVQVGDLVKIRRLLAEQFREVEREAQGPVRTYEIEWDAIVAALGEHAHPGLTPAQNVGEVVALVGRLESARQESRDARDVLTRAFENECDERDATIRQQAQEIERGRVNQAELRSARDERDHWKTTAECHAALIMKAQDAAGWAMDIDELVEKLLAQLQEVVRAGDALVNRTHHSRRCMDDPLSDCLCKLDERLAAWDAATKGIQR